MHIICCWEFFIEQVKNGKRYILFHNPKHANKSMVSSQILSSESTISASNSNSYNLIVFTPRMDPCQLSFDHDAFLWALRASLAKASFDSRWARMVSARPSSMSLGAM